MLMVQRTQRPHTTRERSLMWGALQSKRPHYSGTLGDERKVGLGVGIHKVFVAVEGNWGQGQMLG